jgi:hypothetical protein
MSESVPVQFKTNNNKNTTGKNNTATRTSTTARGRKRKLPDSWEDIPVPTKKFHVSEKIKYINTYIEWLNGKINSSGSSNKQHLYTVEKSPFQQHMLLERHDVVQGQDSTLQQESLNTSIIKIPLTFFQLFPSHSNIYIQCVLCKTDIKDIETEASYNMFNRLEWSPHCKKCYLELLEKDIVNNN